jgi:hypothetical protein
LCARSSFEVDTARTVVSLNLTDMMGGALWTSGASQDVLKPIQCS